MSSTGQASTSGACQMPHPALMTLPSKLFEQIKARILVLGSVATPRPDRRTTPRPKRRFEVARFLGGELRALDTPRGPHSSRRLSRRITYDVSGQGEAQTVRIVQCRYAFFGELGADPW